MMPGDRRRIAESVRVKYRRLRRKPSIDWKSLGCKIDEDGFPIEPEEVPFTVEERFDLELTGIDKYILEGLGVQV